MIESGRSAGARWQARPYSYAAARRLAGELGVSQTAASILVRRGFGDVEAARRFLRATESHDPSDFDGMAEAVELVLDHVRRGSRVAVHGDYDVDGVCSTALLVRALEALGARVTPRLPNRQEGYGLSERSVRELSAQGCALLVTADCGIGALAEVALARRLGMDVLVTDHHRPGEELPECPLIHPGLCGYPFPDLCATAVVYKLCQALFAAAGRDQAELEQELDLVALATIADVVPLVGENRTLARRGLRALAGTGRPGLRALMRVAGVEPQRVGEQAVGFALAPRINAAGRLYRADAALELLLTQDSERALAIARELDGINSERQAVETRILFEAEGQLADDELRRGPLYVLAGEDWHAGVIGIVASRLVERYHRPCVLVALDGAGGGRGSGRSIGAYDLHAGLAACAGYLERFGGHRMAAGLELRAGQLDRFRDSLIEHAGSVLGEQDLVAVERVDAVVPGDAVALELAEELECLRPFGMGNPSISLLVPAARVADVRPMGEGRHASLTFSSAGTRARAVAFGVGARLSGAAGELRHDLLGRLEAHEWRGAVEPRLVLRSLHPVEAGNGTPSDCSDCACRARGESWWTAVWRELEATLGSGSSNPAPASPEQPERGGRRTLIDARGKGILGTLGDLLSSGDRVAIVCADVSRRRTLLACELEPARFERPPALMVSGRCAPTGGSPAPAPAERAVLLADYGALARDRSMLEPYTHLFALDPPPLAAVESQLRATPAAGRQEAFLHLGWGPPEAEFARLALEHELPLRSQLEAVYRALAGGGEPLAGKRLEAVLSGDGRHPRSPALVGRCLRVLREVGLVELERSSATVRCTIIPDRRVELERSQAFRAYAAIHREALEFLSEPAQPMPKASAA